MPTVKKKGLASIITLSADEILAVMGHELNYYKNTTTTHGKPTPNYGLWYKYESRRRDRTYRQRDRKEHVINDIDSVQLTHICNSRFIETIDAAIRKSYASSASRNKQWHGGHESILAMWIDHIKSRRADSIEAIVALMHDYIRISEDNPIKINRSTWLFKGFCYSVGGPYTDEQFRLLIIEEFDKERRLFERLKQKHDSTERGSTRERIRIPEYVRVEVWRRDSGKCTRCDSRENLEYDHIVPLSRGGSNTARNIELLCEKCNRSKGANIG